MGRTRGAEKQQDIAFVLEKKRNMAGKKKKARKEKEGNKPKQGTLLYLLGRSQIFFSDF